MQLRPILIYFVDLIDKIYFIDFDNIYPNPFFIKQFSGLKLFIFINLALFFTGFNTIRYCFGSISQRKTRKYRYDKYIDPQFLHYVFLGI